MMNRRAFLLSATTALSAARASAAPPNRKILVTLWDGFGPEYLERSEMPNLKRLIASGFHKIADGVIPSVTNVNNTSLVTGCFPEDHGITTNFYFDPSTGESRPMEDSQFVLKPTIFERAARHGYKTAIISAKHKVRTLCSRGAHLQASAEQPSPEWIAKAGPAPNMYSPESNYWIFRAARHAFRHEGVNLLYLSTTDYMMHTYAPEEAPSLEHLYNVDKLLGDLAADNPGLEIYLTADHGMNAKTEAIDPSLVLRRHGIESEAVPIIRDKHKVHHGNLGGACYIYLAKPGDLTKAAAILHETEGIEEVYNRRAAAKEFRLYPSRIGDLFILARKRSAFGNLEREREPAKVRTHGSRYEAKVPILAYGRKVNGADYRYNLDLTRLLRFDAE
jgi:phosphonoacetate hydrolase